MNRIKNYLNEHDGAKTREIADAVGLSTARTRALLNSMEDVVATGEYVNRRYWTKK
ncbi:MAG: winged helix-turn-helix domain-containing protein [Anaerovoracaceae bacterium]